eukprot:scaffold546993_cov25-Prasinocladus_malaysianus.AAC.1
MQSGVVVHVALITATATRRVGLYCVPSHLRAAKAAVGCVGGLVGPAKMAGGPDIGDLVAVVDVKQSAVHDGGAQVQCVARVVVQIYVQGVQLALLGEADLSCINKRAMSSVHFAD